MATMTVSYLTVDGEILSETRSGTESDYVPDPLGSTADLLNSSQTITDSFTWWPYGESRSHSPGSSLTPFGYVGTLGYYAGGSSGRNYVRANVLRPSLTRWQSLDRLWPGQPSYAYCWLRPIDHTDPSGLYCYQFTQHFGIGDYSYIWHKTCYYIGLLPCLGTPAVCTKEWDKIFISRYDMPSLPGLIGGYMACLAGCKKLAKNNNLWTVGACAALCAFGEGGLLLMRGCIDGAGNSCAQFTPTGCWEGEWSCCGGYGGPPTSGSKSKTPGNGDRIGV